MKIRILEELFPSTSGKVKVDWAHTMNRQFYRCFTVIGTMFLWALFLMAFTASYLSFQSFVDTSSKYFSLHWEEQFCTSAQIRRPYNPTSASGGGISVLVTGIASFVGCHVGFAVALKLVAVGSR